jgi:hypothetical protein
LKRRLSVRTLVPALRPICASGTSRFAFVAIMRKVPHPARLRFNAIFVAGAGAAYLSGGLGAWELAYTAVATVVAYRGLDSYRWIGVGWLMHTGWDIVHHLWADPILPFLADSSFGCAITDALIAIWFVVVVR